jgi:hypothetical protein
MNRVGSLPEVVGNFRGECPEFMHVQYMPVVMNGMIRIPYNLEWLEPLVYVVMEDLDDSYEGHYIYVTAKHGYVGEGSHQNRPGWHIDGYGTDDLNYIWYDRCPTEFLDQNMVLPEDHELSMAEMGRLADPENIVCYHSKLVLKLDNTVVHRVSPSPVAGLRTFVKISVSEHKYNLKGNAYNYLFDYDWEMHERKHERNHPTK